MAQNKNILVVEDDPDIKELISFNLSNQGHQVFEANNGELGIEKAREKLPDLILLDLMLPGIHGLDVCRIIKADQETKDIPIIMVTAMGQIVNEISFSNTLPGMQVINWNGINSNGASVPSGIYFYQVQAGDLSAMGKMTLVK
tara:strand:- start:112 stop:540 length:429 start_codon:yes stop_codon:yes gene_type:complete